MCLYQEKEGLWDERGFKLTVHFVIPGKPGVWSRPRVCSKGSRVIMFDPKAAERKKIGLSFKQYFAKPFEGAVKVEVAFFYAIKDKKKWGQYKTSRSDLDNATKGLLDCLAPIVLNDDAQVCSLIATKRWHEFDSTYVWVTPL